ncbi:8463_t:CDS:2 [Funneliformis geosporum]|nr:8463_t:CDS:2 [Funneliformis geosporum]
MLSQITYGLKTIHDANFIHRDFHSGNILLIDLECQIGDLGLSQPATNTISNDEIYGVIPYIAPEVFNGAPFSKASDIYSLGMIMWEFTTGCKPFANVDHNVHLIIDIINGKRPKITSDTPECFANLMIRCWDSDPLKRPSITEIHEIFSYWVYKNKDTEQYIKAEQKRSDSMSSGSLGPELDEIPLISSFSSINSFKSLDINNSIGKRPEITSDTPECFVNLMKRCWNSITEIHKTLRLLGPEFDEIPLISSFSSINSFKSLDNNNRVGALSSLIPDFHQYLQKHFKVIKWDRKLEMLCQIVYGLKAIHNANFIHRDFHSGNIILSDQKCHIGDLGLSQSANNTPLKHNEIYGVVPYIAPEVFNGAPFSKASDIYSLGMIMWEFTTGCKPFANVDHNVHLIIDIINGKRPKITSDTPECFIDLLKRCWDSDPLKRPSITEIHETLGNWVCKSVNTEQYTQAEQKRLDSINSGSLGPEFIESFYTSRVLSSFISRFSSNG